MSDLEREALHRRSKLIELYRWLAPAAVGEVEH
jgi:hypothetical protein